MASTSSQPALTGLAELTKSQLSVLRVQWVQKDAKKLTEITSVEPKVPPALEDRWQLASSSAILTASPACALSRQLKFLVIA